MCLTTYLSVWQNLSFLLANFLLVPLFFSISVWELLSPPVLSNFWLSSSTKAVKSSEQSAPCEAWVLCFLVLTILIELLSLTRKKFRMGYESCAVVHLTECGFSVSLIFLNRLLCKFWYLYGYSFVWIL